MKLPEEFRPSTRLVVWVVGILIIAALALWALELILEMLEQNPDAQ
jgi:hypothetical protein